MALYLVTQGRGRINQLGYDMKKGEYVYLHKGKEVWREKGDAKLLDYFNDIYATHGCTDEEELKKYPIYTKYEKSCHEFELKEWGGRIK